MTIKKTKSHNIMSVFPSSFSLNRFQERIIKTSPSLDFNFHFGLFLFTFDGKTLIVGVALDLLMLFLKKNNNATKEGHLMYVKEI